MFKKIFLFLFILNIGSIHSQETGNSANDDNIVQKIHDILIKEYGNYKDKSLKERIVLILGKKAFIDSINTWENNYKNLDEMPIVLNTHMEDMAQIAEKYGDHEQSHQFRNLLVNLTKLGFRNMQMYYIAVKEYLTDNKMDSSEIDINLIDNSLANLKFFEMKKSLYDEEEKTKKEMLEIMYSKKLKFRMAFYIFAFNFFNDIREKVIERDLARMKKNIENKIRAQ